MMTYEKPVAEIIRFGENDIFMTASGNPAEPHYSTAEEALSAACTGYNGGATNNFSCSDFGGYNSNNPPTQKAKVVLGGGTYVFDYVGKHWKLEK